MPTSRLTIVDARVVPVAEDDEPTIMEETTAPEEAAAEEPSKPSLRLEIQTFMGDRQEYIRDKVAKWMTFFADIGSTKLCLDEFPLPITWNDRTMIVRWLADEEGFTVSKSWFAGKTYIYLDKRHGK